MPTIQEIIVWLQSTGGRTAAAVTIFGIIWLLKNAPAVKNLLTTDRRKLAANVVLSLSPAAVMLLDPSVPAEEAWMMAVNTALAAAGVQGTLKALLGDRLKAVLRLGMALQPFAKPPPDAPEGDGGGDG